MGKDVIIACDFDSKEKVFAFLDKFSAEERKPFVKIGMELYYAEGPEIVREIKRRGHKIFLDLLSEKIEVNGIRVIEVVHPFLLFCKVAQILIV